jgi:phosphinothricin acetyltransferase
MQLIIRDAKIEDLASVLKIVNFEIEHTTSIYDYKKRTLDEQIIWFEKKRIEKMPVIIAEFSGNILGFGTFGIFRPWDGYQFSVEHSIYVERKYRNKGVGIKIIRKLIQLAKKQGYHAMIAGVDATNSKSIEFHKKFGFQEVGRFNEIGYKFEKWLDLVFMQLFLDDVKY